MDNLTYEPIIKVDVADGEKSVKSLKAEISKLRDHILNLTEGTDEYNFAVKKLQSDQRDLDKVMSLTKTTATALEGSYDALVHQMSLLKKEFKATNDEARRNELATQINAINDQLKELDGSMGSWTRNVGNYQSALDGMDTSTKSFKESLGQMNDSIEPTKAKFESVQKISSGVASGFAAVQGAAALLGAETEDLEKVFVKVQSAMAIAQGVGGLGDLVEGVGKAKVAFEGLGTKVKAVSKAMGAAGWLGVILLVVSAIIGLVTWIRNAKKESDKFNLSLKEQKELSKDLLGATSDVSSEFKTLQREYQNLETKEDKKKWLEDNATAFSNLGLAVNDVNIADEIFIKNSDKVIAALKARAKAEALKDKYKEAVVKAEEDKEKLTRQNVILTSDGKLPEGLNAEDWEYQWGGGQSNAGMFKPKTDAANEYLDNLLKAQEKAIDDSVEARWGARWANAEEEAKKLEAEINKYKSKGGNNNNIPTPEEVRDQLVADLLAQDIEVPDEPIEQLDTKVQMQEEGAVYKETKAAMLAIEETYAGDSLKIEERKLERLKELHQKAVDVGDYESQLLLAQDIADQEVALNQAKNDAIVASDEAAAQKRIDIINKVAQAISAASSVTQGILEITQAAAEKDGEITEKEAKRIKGLQIAIATMNMLQGITSALSGVFTTHSGPWDIAMAAVQAASIAASGTANIMKIRNTDLTGSVTSGAQAAVTPNSNIYGTDLPISYTRNVTGQSEIDAINQPQRVYLVETDVFNAIEKNRVRISESEF